VAVAMSVTISINTAFRLNPPVVLLANNKR